MSPKSTSCPNPPPGPPKGLPALASDAAEVPQSLFAKHVVFAFQIGIREYFVSPIDFLKLFRRVLTRIGVGMILFGQFSVRALDFLGIGASTHAQNGVEIAIVGGLVTGTTHVQAGVAAGSSTRSSCTGSRRSKGGLSRRQCPRQGGG